MAPAETLLIRLLLWASAGVATVVPLLILPPPSDPLAPALLHAALMLLFVAGLTFHLGGVAAAEWFSHLAMGAVGRRALGWGVVISGVAAAAVPVVVVSGAGLRLAPSLQYHQLLFVLGSGLPLAAIVLGVRRRFGATAAVWSAGVVGAGLVWAMWRYLSQSGLDAAGGWVVAGIEMRSLVVPWVAGCWVLGLVAFTFGVRAAAASSPQAE